MSFSGATDKECQFIASKLLIISDLLDYDDIEADTLRFDPQETTGTPVSMPEVRRCIEWLKKLSRAYGTGQRGRVPILREQNRLNAILGLWLRGGLVL